MNDLEPTEPQQYTEKAYRAGVIAGLSRLFSRYDHEKNFRENTEWILHGIGIGYGVYGLRMHGRTTWETARREAFVRGACHILSDLCMSTDDCPGVKIEDIESQLLRHCRYLEIWAKEDKEFAYDEFYLPQFWLVEVAA